METHLFHLHLQDSCVFNSTGNLDLFDKFKYLSAFTTFNTTRGKTTTTMTTTVTPMTTTHLQDYRY